MQELIINTLLCIVILLAIVLRFIVGVRADSGMTKKQKRMLSRILIAAAMLLILQLIPAKIFIPIGGTLGKVCAVSYRLLCYWI